MDLVRPMVMVMRRILMMETSMAARVTLVVFGAAFLATSFRR